MSIKPEVDHGQDAKLYAGRVLGFADTREQVDRIASELNDAGIGDERILILAGDDGIEILNRTLKEFFFSDGEDQTVINGLRELRDGHLVIEVEVADRDEAVKVVNLAAPHGGRTFTYFGTLMNEQMS